MAMKFWKQVQKKRDPKGQDQSNTFAEQRVTHHLARCDQDLTDLFQYTVGISFIT